ncbi:MAG TPA: LamG domain-containing protein [Xanthomonadaceae bacterium]|nr:LamG domain-containing protein [Xanthomonadaceae bacterium]
MVQSAVPPDPVAHWPFDGNALDVGGNDLHGVVQGAVPVPDRFGREGRALAFDGSAGVEVPHDALLDMAAGITVSLHFRPDDIQSSGDRMIFGKSNYVSATNFLLRVRPGGFLQWEYQTYTESVELPLLAGQWHHVAVTAESPGGGKRIHVDGVEVATSTPPGGTYGLVNDPLTFGFASYGAERLVGALDEVRLYSRVLSASEILDLALEEIVIFRSGFE